MVQAVRKPAGDEAVAIAREVLEIEAKAITDLIALLADRDGQIRFYAATALHRLTGQTLGRSPADCSTDAPATAEQTRRAWQAWWDQHNAQGT